MESILSYLFWFGIFCMFVGIISVIQLSRIFIKYYNMYPWFGGIQLWKTGYFLLPLGISVLAVREMVLQGVVRTEMTIRGSVIISGVFVGVLVGFALIYWKGKEFLVLRELSREKQAK